ncbi:hypothetical protein F2P81_022031 [Scophthalmus maximus]|uniref:Uncharacterized protein n=1 Tax=Scophthalmus maximus TaxID=52904 RepID=A0A6A4S0J2_SCOMX|nr:hypothetical protein F2P81_022031 [Scophthalmus maximus]
MGTFVTLAEVLEARGSPLDEDEVWCLLLATTEALLDISKKGNMCSVLSPGSVLLSANGSLAFKSCAPYEDVASFTAPEAQQSHAASTRTPAEKMVVYSLGMTLYWCVDYHLPHNRPVQLSARLEGLLLSMCEDMVVRRSDLLTVLEACELHHKAAMLPPAERLIRQLVEDVYTDSVSVRRTGGGSFDLIHFTDDLGPEFIRIIDEPLVVLELPGSIVSKKGKSPTTQRELSVVMPNGRSILVKCEVKSRGGDVFDMIVAHSNLMEHFYFGLAYIDDNEFFFVENDTKISKVAPDSWKKVPTTTLVLYFRIKFFVSDISLLLHKQTRHQFYLQLRKDLLDDRLSCHEETALYLGALALQTEYGDCMPEVYGRNYYRPDQYVPKSVMEKRALPYIKEELLRLHTNNAQMLADESELEFLKVCQQLPEYGVLFHRVTRERKPLEGEIILGVCAKGVIVYEVKDGCRSTSQTFYWRETATISSNRRKFVVESRGSKKKYTFITERSKIATYLCNLCSAQHKFNNEMNSRQLSHSLISEAVCRAQSSRLKSYSCSETPQDESGLTTPQDESLTKLCDDVTARIESRIKQQRQSLNEQRFTVWLFTVNMNIYRNYRNYLLQTFTCSSSQPSSIGMRSPALSQRSGSEAPSGSPATRGNLNKRGTSSEREVLCVSLKKDPKLGLGRCLIYLVMFLSPVSLSPNSVRPPVLRNYESQTTLLTDGRSEDNSLEEVVSVMTTPKTGNRLHVPCEVRVLGAQDGCSPSPSLNCERPEEITVELRKIAGSLGISISGGFDTSHPNGGIYIKSLVAGGAAERDGRVHTGDRLLEVDGIRFQDFTYQQAVECLSRTGEVVTMVVEKDLMNLPGVSLSSSSVTSPSLSPATGRPRLESCSSMGAPPSTIGDWPRDYSFITDNNTQEVTLTKSAKGLGFSFLMCELDPPTGDFGSLVRIKHLFPGQPAEESGRIQEGDVLLAINGQWLRELSYPGPFLPSISSLAHE